jgi:NTE family protein
MLGVAFFSFLVTVAALPADSARAKFQGPDKIIIIKPEWSPNDFDDPSSACNEELGIGLALSGGGARGLSHIGVLEVLERENIDIRFIAGVSMGSIIGGLYSSGYSPDEIESLAVNLDWDRLFSAGPVRSSLLGTQKDRSEKSILRVRFEGWRPVLPRAITAGQNLNQFLETLTARAGIRSSISFDYLDPPLRVICTDLSSGERTVLGSGNLAEAMRASVAVPVAFTPVEIEGRVLVDGGLVDPVPVDVVLDDFGRPVIGVNTSANLLPASSIEDIIDIADQTTTIMSMSRKRELLDSADLIITPDLNEKLSTDFSDVSSLVEAGRTATEQALPRIRELLRSRETEDGGRRYRIAENRILGLSSMPRTFFKVMFGESEEMTEGMIELNLRRAMATGYLNDCRAELTAVDTGYRLDYFLEDNPRIKDVVFRGATLLDDGQLRKLVSIEDGMVLNYAMLSADRKAIEGYYIDRGSSLVRVSTEFDPASRRMSFVIDEGRINRIVVEGNRRTRDWVIMRDVPFKTGEIYFQKEAERAVEDIYGTGLFETVRFLADPDSAGVTLKAVVREKPYNLLRSGLRYDLEYGSKAFVDIADDNLLGAGLELYVSTTVGEKRRSVSLNFEGDRIWNSLYTYRLFFDYGEFKRNFYLDHEYLRYLSEFHHGGELSLGRQIPRLGTISLAGQIMRYRWEEHGRAGRQRFDKGSLAIRSRVDTRDALDFPEAGKLHLLELEFAGELSGDKVAYTRFFTSLESYYRLTERLNFHPGIALGLASNFMPYFDQFTLGGEKSFMGLYADEVVGEKLILGELELRYNIWGRVYMLGRFNVGNIWSKIESVRFSELRYSGGVGMAMKTFAGPISAWYGRTDRGLDALYLSAGYDW